MAVDLAIDYNTGDLVLAPNFDFAVRTGTEVTSQRIRVRLRAIAGEWTVDPTGGQMGSRLIDVLRLPAWRAEAEAEDVIRQALEPMEDIKLRAVKVSVNEDNVRSLNVTVTYVPVEEGDEALGSDEELTTTLTIVG
jgi:hypothetical protein